MLEKCEERVRLLKEGLPIKMIERLYIEGNNFKILQISPVIELVEIDDTHDEACAVHKTAAGCA